MVWNLCYRRICPLRCRFRDKSSMVDAPTILLRSKAEIHTQPISPFPSRFRGGLRAALGGDNGGGGGVHRISSNSNRVVVHRPHFAPALHDRSGKSTSGRIGPTIQIQALR